VLTTLLTILPICGVALLLTILAICGVALTPGDRESTMGLLSPLRICIDGNSNGE